MTTLISSLLFAALSSPSLLQQDDTRLKVLHYSFVNGQSSRYRIAFRHEVKENTGDEVRQRIVSHSFAVRLQPLPAAAGDIRLGVKFEQCSFGDGKTEYANLPMCKAIMNSGGTIRLQASGGLASTYMTGTETNPGGFEKQVEGSIEDVGSYVAVPLPDRTLRPGDSWTFQLPIRFLGGAATGQMLHFDVKATLINLDVAGGRSIARFVLALDHTPAIPLAEYSNVKAKVDVQVPVFTGEFDFSLTDSEIISFNVHAETRMRIIVEGQLINDHVMKYDADVRRQ